MASEWVSLLVDGQDRRAYVSQPETSGKVPGVLVIMEAFGVNKHIQEVTDKLSQEGYLVVAPVLYHRLGSDPLFSDTGEDAEAAQMPGQGLLVGFRNTCKPRRCGIWEAKPLQMSLAWL